MSAYLGVKVIHRSILPQLLYDTFGVLYRITLVMCESELHSVTAWELQL